MKITRDNRKDERAQIHALFKYASGPDTGPLQVQNIHDVSVGGLSFLSDKEITLGTQFKVSVLFPLWKETPIENLDAKVVNCLKQRKRPFQFRVGVQFQNLSDEKKAGLQDALACFLKKKKGSVLPRLVIRKK